MQFQLVKDQIAELNLSVDIDTLESISRFIECQIGSLNDLSLQEQLYTIYAAAGIVVEEKKVLTVDGK